MPTIPSESADPLTEPLDFTSEGVWSNLTPSLGSFARSLVYSSQVPSWRGQEEELVEDIVQETARRIVERAQKAERGEADPIRSLKMITTTAQNYCIDMRRRDSRLIRVQPDNYMLDNQVRRDYQPQLFDTICEHVDQEQLLSQVAHGIASFPKKQRTALLIDLANRMSFDERPTPLQKAFLEAGIQLEQYRQPLPGDRQKRGQHVSLLNYAMKRVAQLPCVQEYITGTKPAPRLRKRRCTARKNC
jgi:DNA-directed RNA polymerase specialized sigma24 family protein